MMAFDDVFTEVAQRETRVVEVIDRAGRRATFLFRELYCEESGCDCRRVILQVHWVEEKRIAAWIGYTFEPPRRRGERQIYLDDSVLQSERAQELLAIFTDMIAKDGGYRELLERHYEMWKRAVNRDGATGRGKLQGRDRRATAQGGRAGARGSATGKDGRIAGPGGAARQGGAVGAQGSATGKGGDVGARGSGTGKGGRAGGAGAAAGRGGNGNGEARGGTAGQGGRAKERGGTAEARGIELVAARGAQAEGKVQQRFRRLLEKVDGLRRRVRAWKEARPDIEGGISAYAALLERRRRRCRDMVGLLDRAYGSSVLGKADRKTLAEVIASLAGELIGYGGHDDLKPLYNRYSRSDFDAEAAAADAAGAEALRSMMEELGMELGDADLSSMEKIKAYTEAQLEAAQREAAAEEERRARRKKSAKQAAAEARREEERRSTGKALQDVYRELARALHPDREQDPEERARKTGLMQEVNVAYEAKDLLRLLELQLELERVEAELVDTIAEERVRHYIRILDEQSKQLAVELEELELPFRLEMRLPPTARLTPANVVARIRADTEKVKQESAALEHDLEAFEDVTRLKAWLKTQAPPPGRGRAREPEPELDLFAGLS